MNDDPQRLMNLFNDALARRDKEERAAFLAAECGEDTQLRQQVESLLDSHENIGGFLLQPVALPGDESSGTVIGRYRLLDEIGEGTFGRVFRAAQTEPMHRLVAIKVIKAGMDTREVVARFEAERQALALMDHPHIAHVFDAGCTTAGRPYFVMELVDGLPVTDFCDRYQLTTTERLALFTKICLAVQHAHQKGIIHRDLKPSNILVSRSISESEPKIIDFGVAKALGTLKLTEHTLHTIARQIVGTPAYMSPEQADSADGDIDTRTDIYSLGVLLYELLTGVPPFDGSTLHLAPAEEIRRVIREADPPKPSTCLRTLGQQAADIARRRSTDPALLYRSLHGDLDWIVMRAIEKDRRFRYQTMSALIEDIHRHLTDQPVRAGPPSTLYRLHKFIRRHRVGTAIAAASIAAVLIGIASLTVGLIHAEHERDRAVAAERRAEAEAATAAVVNHFLLVDLLGQASPYEQPDREIKLRVLVDKAAEKVGERFQDQPLVEFETRLTLLSVYHGLGELENARDQLRHAKELCRKMRLAEDDACWLRLRKHEAVLLSEEGRYRDAQGMLESLVPTMQRVLGPESSETFDAMSNLALTHRYLGKPEEAARRFEEIVPAMLRIHGPEHPDTLSAMSNLAACKNQVDPEQHRLALEEELAVLRRVLGPEHPAALAASTRLALTGLLLGKPDEASRRLDELLPDYQRVLGPEHPDTLQHMAYQAFARVYMNQLEEARQRFEDHIPLSRQALGSEHPETLRAMANLTTVSRLLGRPEETRLRCEKLLPVLHKVLGPEHETTLRVACSHAWTFLQLNESDKSRRLFEDLLPVLKRVLGANHSHTGWALRALALIHIEKYNVKGMEEIYAELRSLDLNSPGLAHEKTEFLHSLALLAGGLADWPRATEFYREMLKETNCPFAFHNYCAMAALMNGDWDTYASECATMAAGMDQSGDASAGWLTAETCLVVPNSSVDLADSTRAAKLGLNKQPWEPRAQLAHAMADFRNGNLEEAAKQFNLLAKPNSEAFQLTLTARYFLALCYHQRGDMEAANAMLTRTSQMLEPLRKRGTAMGHYHNVWARSAATLLVRAEAERAILGREVSQKVDMATLIKAHKEWQPVRMALRRARAAVLENQWPAAVQAFAEAIGSPAFDCSVAEGELRRFWYLLAIAAARHEDQAQTIALCQKLAASFEGRRPASNQGANLAAICLAPADPSPELLDLAQAQLGNDTPSTAPDHVPRWKAQFDALLNYRRGNFQLAIEWAREGHSGSDPSCKAVSLLVHSMAAHQLGMEEEARTRFQQATAMQPKLQEMAARSPEWWIPDLKYFELLLAQATALFEPAEAP